MKHIIPKCEWKILDFEVFENKPKIAPYPRNVVKRRELLLMAQSFLSNGQFAKSKKYKAFYKELYQKTIATYFAWKSYEEESDEAAKNSKV